MSPGDLWDQIVDTLARSVCIMFPSRSRIVPQSNDPLRPMIIQFKIWGNGKGSSLFLQHFIQPEDPDYFHVHRWEQMKSLVLSDRFVEERPIAGYEAGEIRAITHSRFQFYRMDRTVKHHVAYWGPRCWSLFWMSAEKSDQWGWFHKDRLDHLIHWKEFVERRVPSLETGEISK